MTKQITQFKIEMVDVKTLRINPKNPRVIKDINFKKLMRSIEDFPQMLHIRPIVVDKNGMILGGTQRFAACKELKCKQVDQWTEGVDSGKTVSKLSILNLLE